MSLTRDASEPRQTSSRIASLDGLRGVAALVVLVHHSFLTLPALAAPYFPADAAHPDSGSAGWWLSYTPAHLLWAGGEAVTVFFVLSGLVLTLPTLSGRFSWARYYPQRLLRLYLPVIGAVLLGSLIALSATYGRGGSIWLDLHPDGPTTAGMLRDATLLGGTSGVITPLWSLQYEVLFSLLLPLYILGAVVLPKLWPVKIVGLLLIIVVGTPITGYLMFLPVFAVGAMIAVHLTGLRERTAAWSGAVWTTLTALSIALLLSHWLVPSFHDGSHLGISHAASVIGATLIVIVAAFSPSAVRFLTTPVVAWLGRVSFSLYLVHEPIVVATAGFIGPGRQWLSIPLAMVAALVVAAVFYRYVELPAHRLARRVGSAGRRRITEPATSTSA